MKAQVREPKQGVLLVNLGTPDSPAVRDVRRYLREFLSDRRVIDINAVCRFLLVNGIIAPFRSPRSAATYRKIWSENGSPLLYYGRRVESMLRERLPETFDVELAMRYQHPGIEEGLTALASRGISSLTVIPLFPQYASCTVGSVHDEVMRVLRGWENIPDLRLIDRFYDHPLVVRAFAENARRHKPSQFDHVLFSFHGIPERQLSKADPHGHCLRSADCCAALGPVNRNCYRAQCYESARLIAEELGLESGEFSVSFQSRLGRAAWTQPYTVNRIQELAHEGKKRVLVLSPAFVADCLETLYEMGEENREIFQSAGGEQLQLVESLNDSDLWITALEHMILGSARTDTHVVRPR